MQPRFVFLLLLALYAGLLQAEESYPEAKIATPYIEMHTGPGRGFPIFHIVERGESISILKRRTDWFKVRTRKGTEGWVSRVQLESTLAANGEPLHIEKASIGDFSSRRWEAGLTGGDFGGAAVMSVYTGYAFTPNLSAELSVSQALGNYSSSWLVDANLLAQPFPTWKYSPFVTLGAGHISTSPRATLVQTEDRDDATAHVGLGLRVYLSHRFLLRAEYKNYLVFSSNDDNEGIDEWKAGFAFFF